MDIGDVSSKTLLPIYAS